MDPCGTTHEWTNSENTQSMDDTFMNTKNLPDFSSLLYS